MSTARRLDHSLSGTGVGDVGALDRCAACHQDGRHQFGREQAVLDDARA